MEVPVRVLLSSLIVLCASTTLAAEPRARDLGIPFSFGSPGRWNAITDVPGVEVGHVTLNTGASVRTGATVVMPRGKGDAARSPVFGAAFALNGNGEMTGLPWVEESGFVEGPIAMTNTNSVGVVRDAIISYAARRWPPEPGGGWTVWSLPIVAETWDGDLNDIYGMHVKPAHLTAAIEGATGGAVPEGSVGGGTGMVCYEFKCGIGTASRVLSAKAGGYTVGVLVQANHGRRHQMRIGGLPMGEQITDGLVRAEEKGSIIIVIATDAPLLPHQLKRLARRASLGLARTGSVAGNGSGDIFLAVSTAPLTDADTPVAAVRMLSNDGMDPLFEATVGATEEAIVNALVAGRTMTGNGGTTVLGLPHDRVKTILQRHSLLAPR